GALRFDGERHGAGVPQPVGEALRRVERHLPRVALRVGLGHRDLGAAQGVQGRALPRPADRLEQRDVVRLGERGALDLDRRIRVAGEIGAPRSPRRTTSRDRKSTRLNSSHVSNSYAVFCLKKKNQRTTPNTKMETTWAINLPSMK